MTLVITMKETDYFYLPFQVGRSKGQDSTPKQHPCSNTLLNICMYMFYH